MYTATLHNSKCNTKGKGGPVTMYSAKKVIQKHTCKASDIIDLDKI
jgi:hypothetical protein